MTSYALVVLKGGSITVPVSFGEGKRAVPAFVIPLSTINPNIRTLEEWKAITCSFELLDFEGYVPKESRQAILAATNTQASVQVHTTRCTSNAVNSDENNAQASDWFSGSYNDVFHDAIVDLDGHSAMREFVGQVNATVDSELETKTSMAVSSSTKLEFLSFFNEAANMAAIITDSKTALKLFLEELSLTSPIPVFHSPITDDEAKALVRDQLNMGEILMRMQH